VRGFSSSDLHDKKLYLISCISYNCLLNLLLCQHKTDVHKQVMSVSASVSFVVAGQRCQHQHLSHGTGHDGRDGTDQAASVEWPSRVSVTVVRPSSRRRTMSASDGGRWSPQIVTVPPRPTLAVDRRATLHCCRLLIEILMRLLSVRCTDREVVAETSSSCVNRPILYPRHISS